jgi:hypothetical protein
MNLGKLAYYSSHFGFWVKMQHRLQADGSYCSLICPLCHNALHNWLKCANLRLLVGTEVFNHYAPMDL